MVSDAAWWLRHLFVFTLLFVTVPPVVRPEEDVACETLPSEIHIIKGQFRAENKYVMSNIPKKTSITENYTVMFIFLGILA
jgi:hypothetical protein